jgi:ADP-ribose pyrophosphatase YjhB (NUDIX family)
VIFLHRLDHVVDELLDSGGFDVGALEGSRTRPQDGMTHAGDLQNRHVRKLYFPAVSDRPPLMNEPPFQFCPVCGGRLDERQLKVGDPARLVCQACGFVFYLDPKVAVGTIIRTPDDRIVLVRRAIDPGYGKWVFPGGYVDRGEQVLAAARREAREESGLEIELHGLVDIYSYAGRAPIIIVYAASMTGGSLAIDDESLEARLFARNEIPWDDLAFRSTFEALKDYVARHWL